MADYTFYVKVANSKFVLDSVSQATIALGHGITYRFDQSDSSNSGHPLVFSTTSDGTHNSGSAYTTGVTTTGTAGSSGAYVDIAVTSSTPASLYYYCSNHSGMGSAVITTGNTHVTTNNLGLLLPILANADDQWGSHINQSLRKIEDTFGANADVYTYNITGDTTAITGSATAGGTLAFSAGQHLEVYLNGVKLVGNLSSGNDYTVNASTNTITLASNAINGDVVNVVVFKTFQFADAVPATGGTFSGNVAVTGNVSATGNIQVDDIVEKTSAHGVEIDGVTLKDGGGTFTGNVGVTGDLTVDTDTLKVDSTNNKVGIGVSGTPQDALHIVESSTRQLRLEGSAPSQYFKETDGSADENYQLRLDDGKFLIQTNNDNFNSASTKVAIDQSGNFGVGQSSPVAPVHIGDSTGNPDLSGQSNKLLISKSGGEARMTLFRAGTPANGTTSGEIVFGSSNSAGDTYWWQTGRIRSVATNTLGGYRQGNLVFSSSGTNGSSVDAMTIEPVTSGSQADVTIETGNLIIGTAGKGIDFSAQTATSASGASTSSEVLNHFEIGTWTPVITGWSSTSYTNQEGKYTRIGNMVTAWLIVRISGTNGSAHVTVTGLPFATSSGDIAVRGGAVTYQNLPTNATSGMALYPDTNRILLYTFEGGSTVVSNADASNNYLIGFVTYPVS